MTIQYRHEWKHVLNTGDLLILRQRLQSIMEKDPYAVNGKYQIRSLYFDTLDDKALREKIDGVNMREKFRIRLYNYDSSVIHLEKKSKRNGLGSKYSSNLTAEEAQKIVDGKLDWTVDAMLESVGLFDVRERYANKLSGGMKRRLGIAQALIHRPRLIIVDEPTTGLDPEERIRFRNLLAEVGKQDVTIILSTHIVGDISSTCNCMALMNKGEVAFFGSPREMLQEAEGKVWRMHISGDEMPVVDAKYPVISTIPSGTGWEVQVVADEIEGYDAEPYPPNLEHAYVYYMEYKLNRWMND